MEDTEKELTRMLEEIISMTDEQVIQECAIESYAKHKPNTQNAASWLDGWKVGHKEGFALAKIPQQALETDHRNVVKGFILLLKSHGINPSWGVEDMVKWEDKARSFLIESMR